MILADTSAWIEYDHATGSAVDERMHALIATEQPLAVTEPVMMEALAGTRTRIRENELRRLLLRFPLLRFDPAADLDAAVTIYRRCRAAGVTPGGLLDCVIAAVAWRRAATLLSRDRSLDLLAQVIGIELDVPGPSPAGGRGSSPVMTR
jgi:predicted nucleic acid-binding protein